MPDFKSNSACVVPPVPITFHFFMELNESVKLTTTLNYART